MKAACKGRARAISQGQGQLAQLVERLVYRECRGSGVPHRPPFPIGLPRDRRRALASARGRDRRRQTPFAAMWLADHGAQVIALPGPARVRVLGLDRDVLDRGRDWLELDLKSPWAATPPAV